MSGLIFRLDRIVSVLSFLLERLKLMGVGLGSMTGPASACGVFGMRPSVGALSNVGAVPVSA